MSLFVDIPERALAVYAHPDDPEVACGGTLAHWASNGSDIQLVIVNAGDKGSFDPQTDPAELTRRRAGEVNAAADVLKLQGVELMAIPDGEVENDLELRAHLVQLVRRHQPDVVVAPDPTAVFFGDSYINHRDHREVGWAVLDAVAPAASSPLYFPEMGPPHKVSTLLLSGALQPDAWVDVTGTIDRKIAAVSCHTSRVGDDPDLVAKLLRARTAEAGARATVSHAEAYRRVRFT